MNSSHTALLLVAAAACVCVAVAAADVHVQVSGSGASGVPTHTTHKRRGHQCVHDRIMETIGKVADSTGNVHPAHAQNDMPPTGPNIFQAADGSPHARKLSTTYSPIRLVVKLDLLADDADGPYVCNGTANNPGSFVESTGTATSMSDTTPCTVDDAMFVNDEKYLFLTQQILPAAVNFFTDALSVIPVDTPELPLPFTWSDNICFNGPNILPFVCCDSVLPGYAKSPGVPSADFVLYVTRRPTLGSTLAWALPCQYETRTNSRGRPMLGQANFSPARISVDPNDYAEQLSTAIHEIAHALGFTNSRFGSFINPLTGDTLPQSSVVLSEYDSLLQKSVNKIQTPNVISKLKEHFACDNWPNAGGELEDYGGSGTAGSHWEKRIMFNEFMTGTSDPNSVYSAITLALFEDSGWYQVDYSNAERLLWGFNQGCDFVRQRCGDSWTDRFFCDTAYEEACTADFRHRAVCNLQSSSVSLDPAFQYFTDPTTGGSSPYVDYCPYYTRVSSGDCQSTSTRGYWHLGEKTDPGGPNNRCFSGTFVYSGVTAPVQHAACLEWDCDPVTTLLKVTLQGLNGATTVVTCPVDGGEVDVSSASIPGSTFDGVMHCPSKELFCTGDPCDTVTCSGHGTCDSANGNCVCASDFFGTSCESRRCPGYPSDECSSASSQGSCDASTGLCVCANGFSGAQCELQGCPSYFGQECSGSSRGTCDQATGTCTCTTGFVGNGCQVTDCPSTGSGRCGGSAQGTCDQENGLCTCADNVVLTGSPTPLHYTGADCGTSQSGLRPLPGLQFYNEVDGNEEVSLTLQPKEYKYYNFTVPSVDFPITVTLTFLTANGGSQTATIADVHMVASYLDTGSLPSLASHEFGEDTDAPGVPANAKVIVLSSTDGSSTQGQNPFDKTGTMVLALVFNGATDETATVQLKLSRSGCATLDCQNGAPCENGVCLCSDTYSIIHLLNPTRSYQYGFAGTLCNVPDCPGTPDCSGRGTCVVDAGTGDPTCQCGTFYTGDACENTNVEGVQSVVSVDEASPNYDTAVSRPTGRTVVGSIAFTDPAVAAGTVVNGVAAPLPVNGAFTTAIPFNTSMAVLARLIVHSGDSDAMLLTGRNEAPTLKQFHEFDVTSWTSKSLQHTVATTVAAGTYFITVRNSRYANAPLRATLYYEAAELCPPSMTLTNETGVPDTHLMPGVPAVACNGNGDPLSFCVNPNTVSPPSAPVLCKCNLEWEGPFCGEHVPRLVSGVARVTDSLAAGDWRYFVYPAPSSVKELRVRLTRTSQSNRAQPLVQVGRTSTRGPSSLASVQTSALFDFDSFTAGTSTTQTVRISRSSSLSPRPTTEYFYVGVQNTANARAPLVASVRLDAYTDFQATCPTAGGAATENCLNASATDVCYGRGVAQFTGSGTTVPDEGVHCRCQTGWNRRTFCGSPKVFDSFSTLVDATQSIQFLCNVCEYAAPLETSDVVFFSVPQPLQKATGLTLSTVNGSTGALANPSLMVAQYQPRSVADFQAVSSSDGFAEAVSLTEPSSTGRYYVAVYANLAGHVTVQADREKLDGDGTDDEQFIVELFGWLTGSSVGNVVFVLSLAFLLCVCMGCCCQHLECKDGRPKRREHSMGVFGSTRNLGLFNPQNPELAHPHKPGAGGAAKFNHPRAVQATNPLEGKRSPQDAIQAAQEVELARMHARDSARFSNPMHNNGSYGQQPPAALAAPGGMAPAHYMPQQQAYAVPQQQAYAVPPPQALPQHMQHDMNAAARRGSMTPIAMSMPDGSTPPPPPPLSTAPRGVQMRLRAMRAGSMVGGQGAAILAPPSAVPPPPSI